MTYYFTAEWCAPCKSIKPKVIESGKAQIVDIDSNKELVKRYNIKSVPTVIVANGDSVTARYSGVEQINAWLLRN